MKICANMAFKIYKIYNFNNIKIDYVDTGFIDCDYYIIFNKERKLINTNGKVIYITWEPKTIRPYTMGKRII